jgi:hypothetical protein
MTLFYSTPLRGQNLGRIKHELRGAPHPGRLHLLCVHAKVDAVGEFKNGT